MELKYKIIPVIIIMIALVLYVNAVEQKIYVDSNHNAHDIYNVSNLTISGNFTDGTLTIKGGDIFGADDINATEFYQAGNLVIDSATVANTSGNYSNYANSSAFWDDINLISSVYFYVTSELLTFNESKVNLTIGLQVTAANDSMRSYVGVANDSMIEYTGATFWNRTGNISSSNISQTPVVCPTGSYMTYFGGASSICTVAYYYQGLGGENITSGVIDDDYLHSNITRDTEYQSADLAANDSIKAYYTSSDNISIDSGVISFNKTCEQITRGSGLCDGTDADTTYSGSDNISVAGNVISFNKTCEQITGGAELCDGTDADTADTTIANETTRVDLIIGTYIPNNITQTIQNGSDYSAGYVNITMNLTVDTHHYICFNASCGKYIYDNGTALVIKVN